MYKSGQQHYRGSAMATPSGQQAKQTRKPSFQKKFGEPKPLGQFTKMPPSKIENTLKIIPLGGCEEVGRNMTVFEYGQDIVVLDMGLQFPEEDMPGIDYIIPDTEYLKGKKKRIKAII